MPLLRSPQAVDSANHQGLTFQRRYLNRAPMPEPRSSNMTRLACTLILFLASTLPAAAHVGSAPAVGFVSGFLHPLTGLDHLLAMLALGLWAAVLAGRSLWLLPLVFLISVAAGALAPQLVPLSQASEWLVLASAVFFPAAALLRPPIDLRAALPLTVLFALAHGYAHGGELSLSLSDMRAGLGLLAATAMLHLIGVLAYRTSSTDVRARRATS
jgi:urease accessory protein